MSKKPVNNSPIHHKALDQKSISTTIVQKAFVSPLPPPEIIEEYSRIIPDAGERILVMAEKQQIHRMKLESKMMNQNLLGQYFAFILAILLIFVSFVLSILEHDRVAMVLGTTTIIGLVSIFVVGKKLQKRDLEKINK